ncbi:MAG: dipeptidase [Gammaproteobacteria bacterium]|nr:dipeptidase [Gammaproteobacteria bacterium]
MKRLLVGLGVALLLGFAILQWVLPGQVESSMNVNLSHDTYTISPQAQQLHDSLFVADLHSDSLLWKRDLRKRSEIGHVDLPRLRQGNVAVQVMSAVTKSPKGQNYDRNRADSDNITMLAIASLWPLRTWDSLYERAAYQLEKLHDLAADNEIEIITSKSEMLDFVARRDAGETVVASVYLIEGAHPLEGNVENLDRLYQDGLRIAGLTHFFDNELGGSLHGITGAGLTGFGRDVVQRANELGVIIDIAHASPQMVSDVLDLSSAPTILSHGGVKGACDSARNLDDELMREFAAKGGLIGIGYWNGAICDDTPAGVVRSIRYAVDLLGIDHVALGSDYDGSVAVRFDTSELAILTQTMLDAGFAEEEIRKVMGENVKRFLLQNLPDE